MTDGTLRVIGLVLSVVVTSTLIFHLEAYQYRFVRSTLIFIGFQVIYSISPTRSPHFSVRATVACHVPSQEAIQVSLLPYSTPLLLRQEKQVA